MWMEVTFGPLCTPRSCRSLGYEAGARCKPSIVEYHRGWLLQGAMKKD